MYAAEKCYTKHKVGFFQESKNKWIFFFFFVLVFVDLLSAVCKSLPIKGLKKATKKERILEFIIIYNSRNSPFFFLRLNKILVHVV
jgi:hypothetical protein